MSRVCPTALLALAATLLAAPALAITGVCPDGSIFIVQSREQVPCRKAKLVEPGDVPPIHPELLPRPYGWERFNRATDPNNPYNVIDSVQQEESAAPAPSRRNASSAPTSPPAPSVPAPQVASAPPPRVAPVPSDALDLRLSSQDVSDLALIIDLMQQRAPATVARRDGSGAAAMTVQLANSGSFETRVRSVLAGRGVPADGHVLLFNARSAAGGAFHGNLTFVQGHVAFHPDTTNATQFGILDGALGSLGPEQSVLGYAVLPPGVDLARPVDVYWNDIQATVKLRP